MVRTATTAAKAGIPAVAIVGSSFIQNARLVARFEDVPNLPIAVYPGAIQGHTREELETNIDKIIDQIIEGITNPAPIEQTAHAQRHAEQSALDGNLDQVHAHFVESKWSDGHPIIPPTAAKVREFLKYTDRAAHETVATLPIAYARATPWNIAVNAVMAGCLPQYMPVLIAAVEALGEIDYDITGLGSTGGYMPFLILSGPVARQLDVCSNLPMISHRPNAVIGRALGLIVRNIGGFIPGDSALGTFGYILPFVFAEDEATCAEIGWSSLRERRGYARGANVVTVGGSGNWGHQSTPTGSDAKMLVDYGLREVRRRVIAERSVLRHDATTMMVMVITPPVAKVIARGGYSVESLRDYWFEHATILRAEFEFRAKYGQSNTPPPTVEGLIANGTLDPKWFARRMDEEIPMLPRAESLHIVVAGDRGRNKYMSLWAPYFKPVSREVKLPMRWDELLRTAPH